MSTPSRTFRSADADATTSSHPKSAWRRIRGRWASLACAVRRQVQTAAQVVREIEEQEQLGLAVVCAWFAQYAPPPRSKGRGGAPKPRFSRFLRRS